MKRAIEFAGVSILMHIYIYSDGVLWEGWHAVVHSVGCTVIWSVVLCVVVAFHRYGVVVVSCICIMQNELQWTWITKVGDPVPAVYKHYAYTHISITHACHILRYAYKLFFDIGMDGMT